MQRRNQRLAAFAIGLVLAAVFGVAAWPHVELRDGELVRHGVVGTESAIPDDTPGLDEAERQLTIALVERMQAVCREADIPFVLLRLGQGDDAWLLEWPGLRWMELNDVGGGVLPFDGHPNAEWHRLLALRLAPLMQEVRGDRVGPHS